MTWHVFALLVICEVIRRWPVIWSFIKQTVEQHSICRWLETPWRSCDVAVMTLRCMSQIDTTTVWYISINYAHAWSCDFAESKITKKIFTCPTYKLLLSWPLFPMSGGHLFQIKIHLICTVLLSGFQSCSGSFEIHWVRQCLVNVTDLAGIVNTAVYNTE